MTTPSLDELRGALLRLTPAQQTAAEALVSGATQAAAAEAAGVSRESVCRWARHHPAFEAALNLYRSTLAAERADTARRIRGKALLAIEEALDAGTADPLAVLRVLLTDSPYEIGPTKAEEVLDAEIRRTRANLPPLAPGRTSDGWLDPLAPFTAPTEDERAEQLAVRRSADAAGLTEEIR